MSVTTENGLSAITDRHQPVGFGRLCKRCEMENIV